MLEVLLFLVVVLAGVALVLFYKFYTLKVKFDRKVASEAKLLFDRWRQEELTNEARKLEEVIRKEYETKFLQWVEEAKKEISEEAIKQSTSVILGKVSEQLAPIFIFEKYGINLKDIRFLSTPIDYIAFDGLSDGNLKRIIFIEIKSGKTSTLTPRERQIKEIIERRKVYWLEINIREELERVKRKIIEQKF